MDIVEKYKYIHPGKVILRELEKRQIKQRPFAQKIGMHPQTLNAICKGRRKLPLEFALKMELYFEFPEGSLALLQTYFDIQTLKSHQAASKPKLELLRKQLFWDTDINLIDWEKQSKAVILRVYKRGTEREKQEINRFYGTKLVNRILTNNTEKPYKVHR